MASPDVAAYVAALAGETFLPSVCVSALGTVASADAFFSAFLCPYEEGAAVEYDSATPQSFFAVALKSAAPAAAFVAFDGYPFAAKSVSFA